MGIFKGRRRERTDGENAAEEEDKFPFGVPGEDDAVTSGISYVIAQGEMSRESDESGRRKSMVFQEREGMQVEPKAVSSKKGKAKKKGEPVVIRGILKSTSRVFGDMID